MKYIWHGPWWAGPSEQNPHMNKTRPMAQAIVNGKYEKT